MFGVINMSFQVVNEQLPKPVMTVLEMLFQEGNAVHDFKIIGNQHGYSITLHISDPQSVQSHLSPGRHRSPSTIQHDLGRQHDWMLRSGSPVPFGDVSEIHCGAKCEQKTTVTACSQLHNAETNTESTHDDISLNHIGVQVDRRGLDLHDAETNTEQIHNTDIVDFNNVDAKVDTNDLSSQSDDESAVTDCGECDEKEIHTEEIKQPLSPEEKYEQNIRDHNRNNMFHKMVHDTRNNGSKVYGQTDDMIIEIDEINQKWESWAIHNREEDKYVDEVMNLIHKWPPAIPSKCEYGVETLDTMLPEIVSQSRSCWFGASENEPVV